MIRNDLPKIGRITAIPTEGFHQHGNGGLVFDDQIEAHWVQVGPLIPTVAAGDVNNLLSRLLITVVAAMDMKTRAIEMGKARRQAQTLGSGRGNEAVELCDASRIKGIQGPTEDIIVELRRSNAERNQAGGRLVLEEARYEVKRLVDKPQAIEHHRFDGFPHREVAHFRILVGGLVDNIANTEFIKHASHKSEMI